MQPGKFSAYPLALAMIPILFSLLFAFGAESYGESSSMGPLSNVPSIAPAVTLTAIPNSVNKTIVLAAGAAFGSAIKRVEFLVDGNVVGISATPPYAIKWDTSTVEDGSHSVVARVTDSTNAQASSIAASISVANSPLNAVAH
jgi:hypothetical protein